MSDPIELLERRIERVLAGEEDTVGLHFFCQIGGRYDESGITTLQISGSGWALLSWRGGDETDMFSYQLSGDDMLRFYRMLQAAPFWRAPITRRGREDDEFNVHLRLSDQAKGISNGAQFWSNDMQEFDVLRDVVDRIDRLVRLLSDDEIAAVAD